MNYSDIQKLTQDINIFNENYMRYKMCSNFCKPFEETIQRTTYDNKQKYDSNGKEIIDTTCKVEDI